MYSLGFVHGKRGKTPLPQVSSPAFPEVYATRVAPMRFANRLIKRLFSRRNRKQVYMVWHQAICPYFDVPVRTSLGHQVYVCLIIFIAEECLQTPIPLLSYMMHYFWNYHTSNPGHGRILTILKTKSIIKYGVPIKSQRDTLKRLFCQ